MNRIQVQLLGVLSNTLFDSHLHGDTDINAIDAIALEAVNHAVMPLVYGELKSSGMLNAELQRKWDSRFNYYIRSNIQIEYQHTEAECLMKANGIPCVFLKGCASGRYYKTPMLRTYGDVDFLIEESNFNRAMSVLEVAGFVTSDPDDGKKVHVSFHRNKHEVWELHRSVNGIPTSKTGTVIRNYLSNIISTSIEAAGNTGSYRVPDDFHHCFILLLHTASHLTSEGIGLRHLCDWAVFVSKVDVEQWKDELESCGLWRFAQILTSLSTKYLGLPEQVWVESVDEGLLDRLMPSLRLSGDIDFMMHTDDRDRVHELLINSGYTADVMENHEWSYKSKNAYFEVHDRLLFEENYNTAAAIAFCDRCWDYVIDNPGTSRKTLNLSFHFVYLLLHLRKHMLYEGAGFRQFYDLAVLAMRAGDQLDWEWIRTELMHIHLLQFAQTCMIFCYRWFEVSCPLAEAQFSEEFYEAARQKIFTNGVVWFWR